MKNDIMKFKNKLIYRVFYFKNKNEVNEVDFSITDNEFCFNFFLVSLILLINKIMSVSGSIKRVYVEFSENLAYKIALLERKS